MIEQNEKPDKVDWHRLWGLMMTPLFERLGCETIVEMDLSKKEQRLDMVVLNRAGKLNYDQVSPDYYHGFEQLNEHNLISFKSFREVFNIEAMEEFLGHYTNYKKQKNISEKEKGRINLYAVTHHYPKKLFSRFEGTECLQCIEKDRIYDFTVLTPVRFIITKKITHPIIGLFSDNTEQIMESRERLEKDWWLIKQVSGYLTKLYNFYFKEGLNMTYTQEMFIQDHYPEWHDKIQTAKKEGKLEGRLEGRLEGILIGRILVYQELTNQLLYSREELVKKSIDELKRIIIELEQKLNLTTFH